MTFALAGILLSLNLKKKINIMTTFTEKVGQLVQLVKADFNGAVDAQTKRNVLEAAKTVADTLLAGSPFAVAIVNFIIGDLEATIKG